MESDGIQATEHLPHPGTRTEPQSAPIGFSRMLACGSEQWSRNLVCTLRAAWSWFFAASICRTHAAPARRGGDDSTGTLVIGSPKSVRPTRSSSKPSYKGQLPATQKTGRIVVRSSSYSSSHPPARQPSSPPNYGPHL